MSSSAQPSNTLVETNELVEILSEAWDHYREKDINEDEAYPRFYPIEQPTVVYADEAKKWVLLAYRAPAPGDGARTIFWLTSPVIHMLKFLALKAGEFAIDIEGVTFAFHRCEWQISVRRVAWVHFLILARHEVQDLPQGNNLGVQVVGYDTSRCYGVCCG